MARIYRGVSNKVGDEFCDKLGISRPVAERAIAPTGTIGILAGTSTGIEPIFAVALKRRYLREGTKWHYQYVIDSAAQELIDVTGWTPTRSRTPWTWPRTGTTHQVPGGRSGFVDQSISSHDQPAQVGQPLNNPDTVKGFALTLAKYAPQLRGFTCYPDGAAAGSPLHP